MKYDHVFDSSIQKFETKFEIDRESKSVILFEKERVILKVDAHGNVIFCNLDGEELYKDKADTENKLSTMISCRVIDNKITVKFFITKTVDHYPNCDGEYDRYSEIIIDESAVTYTI